MGGGVFVEVVWLYRILPNGFGIICASVKSCCSVGFADSGGKLEERGGRAWVAGVAWEFCECLMPRGVCISPD